MQRRPPPLANIITLGVQNFDAQRHFYRHGTGMGLSISRTVVESHGGRLWAADNPSRGASFCFTLPANVEGA